MIPFSNKKPQKVFISYSNEDREIAEKIFNKLRERKKYNLNNLYDISIDDTYNATIKNNIASSDFILLLISKNFIKSQWMSNEFSKNYLNELNYRDITLVPILTDKTPIPEIFSEYQYFSLSNNLEKQIDILISRIENIPKIDFSKLTPSLFENLVFDLLKKLKFKDIQKEDYGKDFDFDLTAEYKNKDPFGKDVYESWLIEIKYYHEDRVRLETIDHFNQYLRDLRKDEVNYKGLLITNGKLSSTILNKIDHYNERDQISLRVIDGTELKRLLLKNSSLIEKYFGETVRS